eukprot:6232962-Alexandrium_andersonii.AAC.1
MATSGAASRRPRLLCESSCAIARRPLGGGPERGLRVLLRRVLASLRCVSALRGWPMCYDLPRSVTT